MDLTLISKVENFLSKQYKDVEASLKPFPNGKIPHSFWQVPGVTDNLDSEVAPMRYPQVKTFEYSKKWLGNKNKDGEYVRAQDDLLRQWAEEQISQASPSSPFSSTSSSSLANYGIDWTCLPESLRTFSQTELLSRYHNVLRADLNRGPWTCDEESKLYNLANDKKYDGHHWANIADELGTRRSPMQCFKHYQIFLNKHLISKDAWTKEETETMLAARRKYGQRNWTEITHEVPHRTANQCFMRARNVGRSKINQSSGAFSDIEERLLVLGAIAYGVIPFKKKIKKGGKDCDIVEGNERSCNDHTSTEDMEICDERDGEREREGEGKRDSTSMSEEPSTKVNKKKNTHLWGVYNKYPKKFSQHHGGAHGSHIWSNVADLLPGRDESQVRDKWLDSLDPRLHATSFTSQEDEKLLETVRVVGRGNWAKVALQMPGRCDKQLMKRWEKIAGKESDEFTQQRLKRRLIYPSRLDRKGGKLDSTRMGLEDDFEVRLRAPGLDSQLSIDV
jgi:hypothetical protein